MSSPTPLRFEILPFPSVEREAAAAPHPLTVTVTCSPRQGMDHSLDVAERLRRTGHSIIVHMAARMVRGPRHLDELLERMAGAGISDVFLIAGDASEPHGPHRDALELLPALRAHRFAPRTIGVPAYPEGHPFIDRASLARALRKKDAIADYMTTQLCFDPDVLLGWLADARADGIRLPLYVGIPGAIDRRKLLEISMRVGVGNSVRFVRKQNGITRLFGRRLAAAEHLHAAIAPRIGERDLGIAGLHYFTFNRLVETARWAETRASEGTFTALACPATAIH